MSSGAKGIRAYDAADPTEFGDDGDLPRRYLLNPAIFGLLRDVKGKSVLDAGSGQGYLARMLARRGARVTAVEPSETFIRYAMEREQKERLGIRYEQADLTHWAGSSDRFDAVVANMVFMDIPNLEPAVENCVRALRGGGVMVFSLLHPCFEEPSSSWNEKGYVEVREYFGEYVRPQRYGLLFHRPLGAYLNLVSGLGCRITQVLEPRLSEEHAGAMGSDRDVHVPSFIVVAVTKQRFEVGDVR